MRETHLKMQYANQRNREFLWLRQMMGIVYLTPAEERVRALDHQGTYVLFLDWTIA